MILFYSILFYSIIYTSVETASDGSGRPRRRTVTDGKEGTEILKRVRTATLTRVINEAISENTATKDEDVSNRVIPGR